jgi:hypothetical protein
VVSQSPDGAGDPCLSASTATASRPQRSLQPNTGTIVLQGTADSPSLMDSIDKCIDETLHKLREQFNGGQQWDVVGVGLSTFVMNLVGVTVDGDLVGEDASISYACNSPEVGKEVQALKRYVSRFIIYFQNAASFFLTPG